MAAIVWANGQPSYYDESNTYVYEGTLSHVDCRTEHRIGAGYSFYYTMYFTDGQKFTIAPVQEAYVMDAAARRELDALPKGTKVTVIVSQEYDDICAFWTDEYTLMSLDDNNRWVAKSKLFWYISCTVICFLIAVPLEVLYWFDAFRQLRISRGKQRRKAKRKQLRSELKDPRKKT